MVWAGGKQEGGRFLRAALLPNQSFITLAVTCSYVYQPVLFISPVLIRYLNS